jgi:hypothetical protein
MKNSERSSLWRLCGLVFAAAWSYRFLIAVLTDRFHNDVRKDMVRAALSLVDSGVLGNFCLFPAGPSALQPPGYVLVLAAIFKVFGTGLAGEAAKVVLSVTASSLRCALVPFLAFRFGLGKSVAICSGVAAALWIGALETELQGDWDAPITAGLLIVLTWLHFVKPVGESAVRRGAAIGALWGLTALFNPGVLAVLPGMLMVDAYRAGRFRLMQSISRSAILGVCVLAVLFPWALRNKLSLGEYIWTRDTMPFNIYISYRDGAHWSDPVNTRPSLGHPDRPNRDDIESPCPWISPTEGRRMAEMGELAYLRDLGVKAKQWIRAHPAQSLRLFAQHTFYFWFPPGPDFYNWRQSVPMAIYAAIKSLLTLLAIGGWIILLRTRRDAGLCCGAILALFPVVYYVVNWSSRYRAPIEWLLVMLAAVSVAKIAEAAVSRVHREVPEEVTAGV